MKNLMYTIGITAFLACGIFNVTATLNNPFFGMSHIALAQGSGSDSGGSGFIFYLVIEDCGSLGYYVCCCSDGNGYSCDIPTSRFLCYPGGTFQCSSGLGTCEPNPSYCKSHCCPTNQACA